MFNVVRKRDGALVEFEQSKITLAILKALQASYTDRSKADLQKLAEVISDRVIYTLTKRALQKLQLSV